MRRQFLRAPLDFTRISSNFDPRRRHPILNMIRAHKGVDYAAPTGTIIKAAGDGRVSFVGSKGGYGRVVIVEHGGGISTLYGHMSRFARGLHDGIRVKQGTTIGYVGSSGAATGPHLHYEYRRQRHAQESPYRLAARCGSDSGGLSGRVQVAQRAAAGAARPCRRRRRRCRRYELKFSTPSRAVTQAAQGPVVSSGLLLTASPPCST